MSRLLLLLACLTSMACASAPADAQAEDESPSRDRPNIVLIMADDLGYGDLACYGSTTQHTPHLDALAARGVRFTDYHSNGAVCSPTRAALMTGRYQQRSGVEGVVTARGHRTVGMSLDEVTIAEVLRDAGYGTAMFGKWHLGYDAAFSPIRQGFETFEGFVSGNIDFVNKIDQEGHVDWWVGDELTHREGYLTALIADRAVGYIAEHQDEPFFLYLSHGAPHYPYQGPNDAGFREAGVRQVQGPRRDVDVAYQEMVASLDDSVGRVVAALQEQGVADNTLVIFCSDNGPVGGSRVGASAGPFRGSKGTVYEGGHRVPMIMSWPGHIEPGGEWHGVSIGMDLLPTFAAIVGAQLPEGVPIDGVQLPVLVDGGFDRPRGLHWVHNDQHAYRRGEYKMVVRGDNAPELYNLDADPGEMNDLAGEYPDDAAQMYAAHQAWLAAVREGVEPVSAPR